MNNDPHAWAAAQFAGAITPDLRLDKRLIKVASQMASKPGAFLTQQNEKWSDIKAGYRFLSHPKVTPEGIQAGHIAITRDACAKLPVVLCVQDTSELDFSKRRATKGLGKIGNGRSRGIKQHTALAVSPLGAMIGILHQRWYLRPEAPANEKASVRKARWNEGDLWQETAKAVGIMESCRVVHVCDRGSDINEFFQACEDLKVGCVVRAHHNRCLRGKVRLWETLEKCPEIGEITAEVSPQANVSARNPGRTPRQATLAVRVSKVTLVPAKSPAKNPIALEMYAVFVREKSANRTITEGKPVEWMLLTTEPVVTFEDAKQIVQWYMHRWVIEEFHRAMKEGCQVEASQLDSAKDIERLAAINGIIAIRLLKLRDMARLEHPDAENPDALHAFVPQAWIRLISAIEKIPPENLTPRRFLRAIAKRGGFIGRKNDGDPGWKTIWNGWKDFYPMTIAFELGLEAKSCG